MVTRVSRHPLEEYLALDYPFHVIADPGGGYVVVFPDLPGCLTQVEGLEDVGPMADDARRAWIEGAYEEGHEIPLPSYPEEYSGKFNVRLPRSLHRSLAEAAAREDISLNQYVVMLLARGDVQARVERRLDNFAAQIDTIDERLGYRVTGVPRVSRERRRYHPGPIPFTIGPSTPPAARLSAAATDATEVVAA